MSESWETYPEIPTEQISRRDYFAAMAMQGACANPEMINNSEVVIAKNAVYQADELIKALDES